MIPPQEPCEPAENGAVSLRGGSVFHGAWKFTRAKMYLDSGMEAYYNISISHIIEMR